MAGSVEGAALLAAPLRETLVILASAAVVIPLFHRLRVSPVLGFMLVGLLVGPSGLGALTERAPWLSAIVISDRARIEPVAEFGVVLLLFMIGLELSFERILTMRRLVFGLGTLQVLVCAAAVAAVMAGLGVSPATAGVVGIALAMSSTAIVTQVLAEERRVTGLVGRASFAVLLFQDLAVMPVLFVLGVLGQHETPGAASFALAVGQALGMVVGLVLLGRLGLRPLFRGVARTQSPELFMAACLLVVLGTGLAAAAAGLSMALGALIAGLLLAETEYRQQIEVTIEPFKGLLLGVFLISIGLRLDLAQVLMQPGVMLGATVGLVLLKATIIAGLARLFRLRWRVGIPVGLLLGPGGEFSFVILGLAGSLGLIGADLASFAFIVAALSMACIPLLSRLGTLMAARRAPAVPPDLLPPQAPEDAPKVVLAGFGRVGRTVAAMLETHAMPYVALDTDAERVAGARRRGAPVYYGDVTNPEMLRRIGLLTATALVVTIDDRARADILVRTARAARPDLLIVVRARDSQHAAHLYALGATDAIPETIEASLQLSEAVLVDLGVPMGLAIASIHEKRAEFQAEIRSMTPDATIRPRIRRRLRDVRQRVSEPGNG